MPPPAIRAREITQKLAPYVAMEQLAAQEAAHLTQAARAAHPRPAPVASIAPNRSAPHPDLGFSS